MTHKHKEFVFIHDFVQELCFLNDAIQFKRVEVISMHSGLEFDELLISVDTYKL